VAVGHLHLQRQTVIALAADHLIGSGARLHQAGCLGCIGMGQAPAVGVNSLRTFPRNFPGRSGTTDDRVWLCSPETAAAAALTGRITDPRDLSGLLGITYPVLDLPATASVNTAVLKAPLPPAPAHAVTLVKAPSIGSLPELDPLPDALAAPVVIKVGDNVSTDEILPAGARVLPYRSNIATLADFAFAQLDPGYPQRARQAGQHVIVAGVNYGQGSSREHAAIVPRHLGLRLVIARSYARIHWQNLANFGILPPQFTDDADYDRIVAGDVLAVDDLRDALAAGAAVTILNRTRNASYLTSHRLSPRQVAMILAARSRGCGGIGSRSRLDPEGESDHDHQPGSDRRGRRRIPAQPARPGLGRPGGRRPATPAADRARVPVAAVQRAAGTGSRRTARHGAAARRRPDPVRRRAACAPGRTRPGGQLRPAGVRARRRVDRRFPRRRPGGGRPPRTGWVHRTARRIRRRPDRRPRRLPGRRRARQRLRQRPR
jgi:3-isopropylmalate dehydratase small subunit